MPPNGICDRDSFEIRNERLGLRDGVLHLRQGQRLVMTGGAVPDFGDPEDVFVGGVSGDDVTEVAGHAGGALFEDANHLLALAGDSSDFHDESVHLVRSLRI